MKYMDYRNLKYELSIQEYLNEIEYRKTNSILLPLKAKNGYNLKYVKTEEMHDLLEEILILYSESTENNEYELEKEALASCIIEGAYTTIADTIAISKGHRRANNKSEKMVENTLVALKTYKDIEFEFTEDNIIKLWKIISKDILENIEVQGDKYRIGEVFISDAVGNIRFEAPDYRNIQEMMDSLIDFCNSQKMHPFIKAIVIHYYFVYTHPFCDGNGRTARFLLTSSLIKNCYTKFKTISITSEVHKNLGNYYKYLEKSENKYNDITYFILFYLEVIKDVLSRNLRNYDWNERNIPLNNRQNRILFELRKYRPSITIKKYSKMFNISEGEAKKELEQLFDLEILDKNLNGDIDVYTVLY